MHIRNGYWRFCTYDDDRRAYNRGLASPEAVLIAQDVGDGVYDDIMLRWVPGELDSGNKPTVGTAAAHLETIYNERRIVGKPLSFRGSVPLYPISTDKELLNYRLMRYGTQRGVRINTAVASPAQQASSSNTTLPLSAPVTNSECCQNGVTPYLSSSVECPPMDRTVDPRYTPLTSQSRTQAASSPKSLPPVQGTVTYGNTATGGQLQPSSAPTSSPPQSRPASPAISVQSPRRLHRTSLTPPIPHVPHISSSDSMLTVSSSSEAKSKSVPPSTPVVTPRSITSVGSSPPISPKQHVPTGLIDPALLIQHHSRGVSPLDPRLRGRAGKDHAKSSDVARSPLSSPATHHSSFEEQYQTQDLVYEYSTCGRSGFAVDSTDNAPVPLYKDLTPLQLFEVQSATLSCMDCGMAGAHASQCWVKSMTPLRHLTLHY